MPILNYTTTIDAGKTVQEICALLAKKGASRIVTDYNTEGSVTGVSFFLMVKGFPVRFELPANWQGVQKALKQQRVAAKYQTPAHAIRVTWRILKDWIAAQMAIVEAEQADMPTIFLPYAVMKDGKTVSSSLLGEHSNQLYLDN